MKAKCLLPVLLLILLFCGVVKADISLIFDPPIPWNQWVMFTTIGDVPFDPTTTYIDLCDGPLTNMIGDPGETWRISWWDHDAQGYRRFGEANPIENQDPPPDMVAGNGYWFIADILTSELVLAGSALDANDWDYVNDVTLNFGGYTIVANPYNAEFDLSTMKIIYEGGGGDWYIGDFITAGLIESALHVWNGSNYNLMPLNDGPILIDAGLGGWLVIPGTYQDFLDYYENEKGGVPGNVTGIKLWQPYGGVQLNPQEPGEGRRDEPLPGWELPFTVGSEDGRYLHEYNKLGIRENATVVFDQNDLREMTPPNSAFVQIYFPHPEYEYAAGDFTYDFRSMEFDGPKEWDFTVRTVNIRDTRFNIEWQGIEDIPENYFLTLVNADTDQEIGDMRELQQVSIESGNEAIDVFHFRVICEYTPEWVGPGSSSLPGGFGLTNAYPNPFNNVVNLDYTLPLNQTASLKVYDMTGKLVDTIGGKLQGEGTVSWNAQGMQSGVYMMHMESGNQVSLKKVILMQ